MNKIIIHGVHRSGTSLTASLLEKAGFWYAEPEHQMAPQEDNPNGFWERTDVVDLNDRVLRYLNLNWFTLMPDALADGSDAIREEQWRELDAQFGADIKEVVTRFQAHLSWYIKDPRLSITWPLWRKYIDATQHIVVHRHPISVAKSLAKRNGFSIDHGLAFWYHQMRLIARSLQHEPQVVHVEFARDLGSRSHFFLALQGVLTQASKDPSVRVLAESDFESLFDSNLVNNAETPFEGSPIVQQAWGYAKVGNLSGLLSLPILPVESFDWPQLESRYALQSQFEATQRVDAQHVELIADRTKMNEQAEQLILELRQQVNQLSHSAESFEQLSLEQAEKISDLELEQESIEHISTERDERLLKISGELSDYTDSKRYLAASLLFKVLNTLGMFRRRSLYKAFDIAKYGHAPDKLESVLHRRSGRYLLLSALIRNPQSFLRRLSVERIRKGLKLLLGLDVADLAVNQALLQYSSSTLSDSYLDLFDPVDAESWRDQPLSFALEEAPLVSIVVPVYNNFLTTLGCLHSIKKNTVIKPQNGSQGYEVLIADDCSSDETEDIQARVNGLTVIRHTINKGFLKNCNEAVASAKGQFIVLLNNDTNVQPGWLEALMQPLLEDPTIGITGPMFIYPDGRLQEAGGIIFSDASGWNYGRFDQPTKPEYLFSRDVDYVSGACLLMRKKLWDEHNGFDEYFLPAYYEDTDFCFQVRHKGLRIRYVPDAKVVHYEGVSHGKNEDSGVKRYQVDNKEKFKLKWHDVLEHEHYRGPDSLFAARVHGRHKKTLLFIDHYVPFTDKDAGSKVAQRYIELLLDEGVHVIFMGENFYPHQPYTQALQAMGVEVLYGEYYKNNWFSWLQENAENIDTIYLNRPHISQVFIDDILTLPNVPYLVYHGADLHYVRVARQEALGLAPEGSKSSKDWHDIEYDIMRKCDLSLWLSHQEVSAVKAQDKSINVAYKPMYWFDADDFQASRRAHDSQNILFVGGFGHPPNGDGLRWFLERVFPNVVAQCPNVVLTVIGSECPPEIKKLSGDNVTILGFVSEEVLIESYANSRVAIVPLRYGAGVKGKVLESMQYGVPVMTTSVGAEGLPGTPDVYLAVADQVQGFAEKLCALLDSDDECNSKITQADDALKHYFSREAAVEAINLMLP